jgi:Ser/Thr protein kinase RdoA (MazF antagonist)
VAVPIGTLDGTTFFEQEGALWQLEPWMPGTAEFWTNPTAGRLEAALECLARWHIAAGRFEPRPQEAPWFFHASSACSPGLGERLRELERWDTRRRDVARKRLKSSAWKEFADLGTRILDAFDQQAPALARELSLGTSARVPLQPCLRDVWHDHLLYTGETVTGLIDPHAARSDSPATDLARLLGSLVADDRQRWEAGVAAYQRIRPLSLDELALVGLFDRSSVVLSGMTWLDWHCLEGREFADQNKVLARLRAIVGRLLEFSL